MPQTHETQSASPGNTPHSMRCVDVKVEKPRVLQVSVYIPVSVGLYFAVVLGLLYMGDLTAVSALLALGIISFIGLIAVLIEAGLKQRGCVCEFRRLLSEGKHTAAAWCLAGYVHASGASYQMVSLLKRFVRHQSGLAAIRIHWSDAISPIVPLAVNFTPVCLNESDAQFVQLADAISEGPDRQVQIGGGLRTTAEETAMGRRFRRNLRLVWAWPGLLIFLWVFLSQAIQSFKQRTITFAFGLYVGLVVAKLTIGAAGGLFESPLEWLIVPGGLLRRKQAKDATRSDIELLTPYTAMVVAVQTRKQAWTVFVTEASRNQTLLLTTTETELLLRAWLSPIPPPSVDKLIDLT